VRGEALPGFSIHTVEPDPKWFKHPQFRPPATDNPVVLICDGHWSHMSLAFLISVQTSHASRQKYFLQPPFDDILAWGGGPMSEGEPSLGAHDLDVQALNETVHANGRRRRKRITNADYFDRSRGHEEMLADAEEREREDNLDAVFCAMGKPKNTAKMEDLVVPVQQLLRWDAAAAAFPGVMGWDEEKKCWGIFSV